jgi:dGTPase
LTRRVITRFVEDAIDCSRTRLDLFKPRSADAVRRAGAATVAFSPTKAAAERDVKGFLFKNMYRHAKIVGVWDEARAAISFLFPFFLAEPSAMPAEWARLAVEGAEARRARVVADNIAGMTDRYALGEYRRLSARSGDT